MASPLSWPMLVPCAPSGLRRRLTRKVRLMNPPATDKSKFDDWLKANLIRDLAFRFIVSATISASATHIAISTRHISPISYFGLVSTTLAPIVNLFGSIAVGLCVLAMLFKDLEAIAPAKFDQSTRTGIAGGIVRRLASDLSLWTFGAIVAVVVSSLAAAASISDTQLSHKVFLLPVITIWLLVGTGLVNYFVRRGQPSPWHTVFGTPLKATAVHLLTIAAQICTLAF
jgi:hypothetical protein